MIIDSHTQTGVAPRALLVDDEESMRRVMTTLLTRHGFEVVSAENGFEAIDLFRRGEWDVVLTDLMMPGMGGDQLATALRTIDPQIPIVLVTGSAKLAQQTFPFDGMVAKPFTGEMLISTLEKAMQ